LNVFKGPEENNNQNVLDNKLAPFT